MIIAGISKKIQAVATLGHILTWKRFSAFAIDFYRQGSKQAILRLLFSTAFQHDFQGFLLGMGHGRVKQAHFTGLQVNLQILLQVGFRSMTISKRYDLSKLEGNGDVVMQQTHPYCVFPNSFPSPFGMLLQTGRPLALRSADFQLFVSAEEGRYLIKSTNIGGK